VVIHAYYPEVFGEILEYIQQISHIPLKLYISTPVGRGEDIRARLAGSQLDYHLQEFPNHGRDVLPFLKLLPRILEDGFATLVKVHTKKSTHRQDGDNWRRDLYSKLLSPQALADALSDFASDSTLGILGPAGHVVPMSFYWGSNALAVEKLACRLGISPAELSRASFVAGTMFFAKIDALLPLMNLALSDEDFESEAGQVDGTFAHALERAIAISTHAAGLKLRSCDGTPSNKRYAYADATL
jgi:lipopolysaccharide biosynthesis protein